MRETDRNAQVAEIEESKFSLVVVVPTTSAINFFILWYVSSGASEHMVYQDDHNILSNIPSFLCPISIKLAKFGETL